MTTLEALDAEPAGTVTRARSGLYFAKNPRGVSGPWVAREAAEAAGRGVYNVARAASVKASRRRVVSQFEI